MSGFLTIIPKEVTATWIVWYFQTKDVCAFSLTSKAALDILCPHATAAPQEDFDLKGNRVTLTLNNGNRTIKALLQQKMKVEFLERHPHFPILLEVAIHSVKSQDFLPLRDYARAKNSSDTTMLSLVHFDFHEKKLTSSDLEKALITAIQFPDNGPFLKAIFSHANAPGIGGGALGIVLREVIRDDNPKLVRLVFSQPNARRISSDLLKEVFAHTDSPIYIKWLLLHSKSHRIPGTCLGPKLITAVNADDHWLVAIILTHPNAASIEKHFLKHALFLAKKRSNPEVLLAFGSFTDAFD